MGPTARGATSATNDLAVFCQIHDLTQDTCDTLLRQGFNSVALLKLLDTESLRQLQLPLAQQLLLKRALQAQDVPAGATAAADGGALDLAGLGDMLGITRRPPARSNISIQDPRSFLQATAAGEKFHDITDFVPGLLTKEESVDLPAGGSKVTLNIGTRKPRLDSITPHQWSAANARIMYTLIQEGSLSQDTVADYLAYTVKISQLGDVFEWVSVLLYDREYRRQQAFLGHAWGADNPHLHTVYLQPKSAKGKPAGRAKPAAYKRLDSKTDKASKEVCRNYNQERCTWGPRCFRAHVCAVCFSEDHTEAYHQAPKN